MVVNTFVYAALVACDFHSALDVYDLHKSGKLKILPQGALGRSLITGCYQNGMDAAAEDVFLFYKSGCYPEQDVTVYPKYIHMPSAVSTAEVELMIKDYIIELYKYLCDEMLEGRKLTLEDIRLYINVEWNRDTKITSFPFMKGLPKTRKAVMNNICKVLSGLQLSIAHNEHNVNSIHIDPTSLEHYLQCRDKEGRHYIKMVYIVYLTYWLLALFTW